MFRATKTRSATTTLAALIAAAGALTLTPGALGAKDGVQKNRDRQAEPARPDHGRERDGKARDGNEPGSNEHASKDRGPNGSRGAERGHDDKGPKADNDRKDARDRHDGCDGRPGAWQGGPSDDHRGRPDDRHTEPQCCAVSGAGVLRVNGCSVEIGRNEKFKKIAKAFKDAGYEAYVRTDKFGASVRVYGFPSYTWNPGSWDFCTYREGNVLEIRLTKI